MKLFRTALISFFIYVMIILNSPLRAGTTFKIKSADAVLDPLINTQIAAFNPLINEFQNKMDTNGPAFADAFAMASTLGYANGKATLGDFPHFQIGLSMNAGLTNMSNFQHSKSGIYNGTTPGLGFAPALTFGVGLGGGVDVIGKFLMFNQDLYKVPKTPIVSIDKYSFYEIGGRIRYNIVKERTIVPFLFSFGGISISAGGDFMRGLFGIGGNYTLPFTESITIPGIAAPIPLDKFSSTYTSRMTWYEIYGTTQALAYFQFFNILSMYTGLGLSVGYGWFTFNFDATGVLKTSDPTAIAAIQAVAPSVTDGTLGTGTFSSKSQYHPKSVFPTYILGLELDIPLVKLVTESQVNLRNRSDVTLSLGVRVQF